MDIQVFKSNGHFSTVTGPFNYIIESGKTVTINTNAGDTKDPLVFFVDLATATMTDINLRIKGVNGGKDKNIPLKAGTYNVGTFTTQGFKKDDGSMVLELWSSDGTIDMSQSIKFILFNNVPVINH